MFSPLTPSSSAQLSANTSSPSIFERDIEHRDAGHIMTQQEAVDVAIPSVLDDAVEAIIEDSTEQIEIVAPQAPPPLALSAIALSVHSDASSPSSPMSNSGQMEAPPGSMAAQIAERLSSRQPAHDDGRQPASSNSNRKSHGHRRPNSDVSSPTSFRSRSPVALKGMGMHEVFDISPVRSRASASPTPGVTSSLAAAVSQATRSPSQLSPVPLGVQSGPSSHSPLPTATAFPSLPLPNPYRSSSPNLPAISTPLVYPGVEAGRPASSSLSIDGAVISSAEAATMDQSLDSIADVIAASDAEEAASPYVSRSPTMLQMASGFSSPVMDRQRARQTRLSGGSSRPSSVVSPGGMLGGLGVFDSGEGLFHALSSGAPSPSYEKRRLSFFSYADILNHNSGEVMDFEGAVRHAAERDEQQHGHAPAVMAISSVGTIKVASTSALYQGLQGSSNISRSVSTSAADSPRFAAGSRLNNSISGANTPLRGRKDVLENQALTNRLESLHLATDNTVKQA